MTESPQTDVPSNESDAYQDLAAEGAAQQNALDADPSDPVRRDDLDAMQADTVSLWRRIATGTGRLFLRVAFVYFILYAYPFPLRMIPDVRAVPQLWHDSKTPLKEVNWDVPEWVNSAYTWRNQHAMDWAKWERTAVDRVAADVFGFEEILDRPRGSGDPRYGYVETAARAGAAVAIALIWFLIAALVARFTSRRDRLLDWMAPWMHVAGRYYLATVLLGYGFAKVYPSQFRFPGFARLETPYGDGSPMNILWSFMGSSNAYIVFSGVMEVLPALLLFSRRTALLGALLGAAVMANVAALNYCYDVPVKLLSTQLFLLAAALTLADLRRLISVFLLNRPAPPRDLSRPRTGWVGHVVRLLILVPYVGLATDRVIESYKHPAEPYELRGIWDVETFLVDGAERIPRTDDALRFQALIIDRQGSGNLKTMDGSLRSVDMSRNKKGDRMTISSSSIWEYQLDGDVLLLTGEHRRTFRADPYSSFDPGTPRDPQLQLRLERDAEFVSSKEIRPKRARVPEELRGRWLSVSRTFVGDTATRRREAPYGWDAIVVEADGEVRVEYPLSVQEFKIRAKPDEIASSEIPTEQAEPEPGEALATEALATEALATEAEAEAGSTEETDTEDEKVPPVLSTTEGQLTLRSSSKFKVERVDDDRMQLRGKLRGEEVEIDLFRRDPASFLLVRRGFHWINEIPMNRY